MKNLGVGLSALIFFRPRFYTLPVKSQRKKRIFATNGALRNSFIPKRNIIAWIIPHAALPGGWSLLHFLTKNFISLTCWTRISGICPVQFGSEVTKNQKQQATNHPPHAKLTKKKYFLPL